MERPIDRTPDQASEFALAHLTPILQNSRKKEEKICSIFKPSIHYFSSTGKKLLQKFSFPCTLQAVKVSHGIVLKCIAWIFFSAVVLKNRSRRIDICIFEDVLIILMTRDSPNI